MLLFFRGELTERLLFWLREPPMATAQSVFVLLSQILRTSLSPPEVHLCLFSVQPGSTSEPHGALPLMTDWLSFNPANLSSLPLCWCCTVQRLTSISDLTRIAVHTVPPPCSTCLTVFLHTPQCDYTDLIGFQKKQDRVCVHVHEYGLGIGGRELDGDSDSVCVSLGVSGRGKSIVQAWKSLFFC